MKFYAMTKEGKLLRLNATLDSTVRDFKVAIHESEGIPMECIRLIYAGKLMEAHSTVRELKLPEGATFILIVKARISETY